MRKIARELLIGVLIFGLVSVGFIGCGEDEDNAEEEEAPELPPDTSMTIDLSLFGGGKLAPTMLPGKNYLNAMTRVLLIDTTVVVVLAAPASVFKAAKSATPVRQKDGSWLWSYTTTVFGHKYDANLTGRILGSKTFWSMKVSCNSLDVPVEDFGWYTGESALDNSSGNWRFFDHRTPDEAHEIGTMEWSTAAVGFQSKDDKNELIFTCTDTGGEYLGDTLTYSVEKTTVLVLFYDASENITSEITWDAVTNAGSLKVPTYNNGQSACWDKNKQDVPC